jgi:phosphonoacetaldehyde hydrolase
MKAQASRSVEAVVFDISGTIMDFGSRGPVRAFVELFARHGALLTEAEARRPMGTHKLDHLKALFADPAIASRWPSRTGGCDIEKLYAEFPAIQAEVLPQHLDVIPGVAETTGYLEERGISYGTTTGFELSMLSSIIPAAERKGFRPGAWLTPDQAGGGRPKPWMIYELSHRLGRYPLSRFVKVGDTPVDVEEARNAGVWAVAVVDTGNEMGLSAAEWNRLAVGEQQQRHQEIALRLRGFGAHYTIGGVADLPAVIEAIEARILAGEKP